MLADKKKAHAREMEFTRKEYERESQRLTADNERAKIDCKQAQLEFTKTERELQALVNSNAQSKEKGIIDEIERLEIELKTCEVARKTAQETLDQTSEQMSVKASMIEPNEDVSRIDPQATQAYSRVSQQLKQKAELGAKLKRRRDELVLEKVRQSGKNDLYNQIAKANDEFDDMSKELESKIGDLTGNLEDVLQKIDTAIASLES